MVDQHHREGKIVAFVREMDPRLLPPTIKLKPGEKSFYPVLMKDSDVAMIAWWRELGELKGPAWAAVSESNRPH